jgi:hypothetical protein
MRSKRSENTLESELTMDYSVVETMRRQITNGVLMSLGAHELSSYVTHGADKVGLERRPDTLTFKARILPSATAGRPRIMRVTVTLDPSDTYSVLVTYSKSKRQPNGAPGSVLVTHKEWENIYADSLATVLLSLDQVI